MGTSLPWQPKCCPGAAPWWGHRWGSGGGRSGIASWDREGHGASQCHPITAQPGWGRSQQPHSEHSQQTGMLKAVVG